MKKVYKILTLFLALTLSFSTFYTSVSAKDFAPNIDVSNPGIQTQYLYSENDVSWIRKLVIKEDMLSAGGIVTESVFHPVSDYPYTTDAPHFMAEVNEYIELYTLDENSQKAAYIYMLEQIGAITIISEPTVSDQTKADWLRAQGIIVTKEDEQDPEKALMISALYAMMKNDLYYVYKGEHLTIPEGTPLEEAVVLYLSSLSGQNAALSSFIQRFFGSSSGLGLEDYIYYTSLMALYTQGYVSATEITTISREEVSKRVAVMAIRDYGIAIDYENASFEELQQKYLTAMLGTHYKVSLDHDAIVKAQITQSIPFYILQSMAYQDAKLTISQTKYTYNQCFDIVLKKTNRFDLEDEFYADIHEYNIYLDHLRSEISLNPTPLSSGAVITLNGETITGSQYNKIALKSDKHQVLNVVSRYTEKGKTFTSTYKLNIYQGTTPGESSNLTGIIGSFINGTDSSNTGGSGINLTPTLQTPTLTLPNLNGQTPGILNNILTLNNNGQLVDQNGNIVSPNTYETLPEGYEYVLGENGIVQILPVSQLTTTEATTSSAITTEEQNRKVVIGISLALCALILIALITTIVTTKKRKAKDKTTEDAPKSRKGKGKSKKSKT